MTLLGLDFAKHAEFVIPLLLQLRIILKAGIASHKLGSTVDTRGWVETHSAALVDAEGTFHADSTSAAKNVINLGKAIQRISELHGALLHRETASLGEVFVDRVD